MSSPTSTNTDSERAGTPQHNPHATFANAHQPAANPGGAQPQGFSPVNNNNNINNGPAAQAHQRNDSIASNGKAAPVPIQRQYSQSQAPSAAPLPASPPTPSAETMTTPVASGPISVARTLPPRARPGRKPIAENSKGDRRRQQNRDAQRKFRDRRAEKVTALQEQLSSQKNEHLQHESEVRRENDSLRQQVSQMSSEIRQMQDTQQDLQRNVTRLMTENQQLRAQLQAPQQTGLPTAVAPSFRASYTQVTTPPDDNQFEIDFTNYRRTPKVSNFDVRPSVSHESNEMDFSMDREVDPCGFCTDDQNCACKQEKEKPVPVEPRITTNAPGSCDMCRADPVRAQACIDMARSADISSSKPTDIQRLTPALMPPPPRRSCASMVDAFHQFGERTSSIASLFGGKLTTYPAAKGGYEFEETQAAEVLSTLSRRSTMVETPQPEERSP